MCCHCWALLPSSWWRTSFLVVATGWFLPLLGSQGQVCKICEVCSRDRKFVLIGFFTFFFPLVESKQWLRCPGIVSIQTCWLEKVLELPSWTQHLNGWRLLGSVCTGGQTGWSLQACSQLHPGAWGAPLQTGSSQRETQRFPSSWEQPWAACWLAQALLRLVFHSAAVAGMSLFGVTSWERLGASLQRASSSGRCSWVKCSSKSFAVLVLRAVSESDFVLRWF